MQSWSYDAACAEQIIIAIDANDCYTVKKREDNAGSGTGHRTQEMLPIPQLNVQRSHAVRSLMLHLIKVIQAIGDELVL